MHITDAIGVKLDVGTNIAWGVGGRYNYGLALGKITSVEEEPGVRREFNRETRSYVDLPVTNVIVKSASLVSGRKGRNFTTVDGGSIDAIAIADQDFVGDKG
jgi:hypothetical protein